MYGSVTDPVIHLSDGRGVCVKRNSAMLLLVLGCVFVDTLSSAALFNCSEGLMDMIPSFIREDEFCTIMIYHQVSFHFDLSNADSAEIEFELFHATSNRAIEPQGGQGNLDYAQHCIVVNDPKREWRSSSKDSHCFFTTNSAENSLSIHVFIIARRDDGWYIPGSAFFQFMTDGVDENAEQNSEQILSVSFNFPAREVCRFIKVDLGELKEVNHQLRKESLGPEALGFISNPNDSYIVAMKTAQDTLDSKSVCLVIIDSNHEIKEREICNLFHGENNYVFDVSGVRRCYLIGDKLAFVRPDEPCYNIIQHNLTLIADHLSDVSVISFEPTSVKHSLELTESFTSNFTKHCISAQLAHQDMERAKSCFFVEYQTGTTIDLNITIKSNDTLYGEEGQMVSMNYSIVNSPRSETFDYQIPFSTSF